MPRRTVGFLLFSITALACWQIVFAKGQSGQSDQSPVAPVSVDAHPVVVELFTSEGCSSCPPADLLLQKLDKYQPIEGAQLIVLSEHVTYWDHDGWKDPNSSAALTDRQTAYEGELGEKEVFTPQIIIDGRQEVSLQNPPHIEEVLKQARGDSKIPVRVSALLDPGDSSTLRSHIDVNENFTRHNADVYVALALSHFESQVLRGENGGHHLEHVAVVQKIMRIGKLSKGKNFAGDVQLKLTAADDPKNLRIIAFVQEAGPGKILGAALWKPER